MGVPRYCLVGVSGFAAVHHRELLAPHDAGACAVVAAAVINQAEEIERCEQLRERGCELFDDYHAMLAAYGGRADCCVIPTAIHLHAPMAIAALEAGMHVLLEKPAAATVADVDAMRAAEVRTGRRVFVAFQSMYAGETLEMKRIVRSGCLGAVREIVSWSLWPREAEYYARNAWAGRLAVDGVPVRDSPFNNAVAHQLHMVLFLAGAEEATSAEVLAVRAELCRAKPIESCDTAALAITTATGVPCRFLCSHACATEDHLDPVIEVRGERGVLRWEFHRRLRLTTDAEDRSWPADADCREHMHAAVRASIAGEAPFVATLEHARAHTCAVELAHQGFDIHDVPPGVVDGRPAGGRGPACSGQAANQPITRTASPSPLVSAWTRTSALTLTTPTSSPSI